MFSRGGTLLPFLVMLTRAILMSSLLIIGASQNCEEYQNGDKSNHKYCGDGGRALHNDIDFAACKAKCLSTRGCTVIQWQGLNEHGHAFDRPGQCFTYPSCTSFRDYGNQNFCLEIVSMPSPKCSDAEKRACE